VEQKRLRELTLCDLYLCMDAPDARYRKDRTSIVNTLHTVPPEYSEDVEMLRQKLALSVEQDFSMDHDGVRYRTARMIDVNGTWFVLSRGAVTIPKLNELGLDPNIVNELHNLGRTTGLILVSGATGAGKTTTSSSLIQDYLNSYGDVAITIEDPPELPLSGNYGQHGRCFQIHVEDDEWEDALKMALRYRPRYMFVGELRVPGAAFHALRAAVSGHLVVATMHAGSIEHALEGLVTMAGELAGNLASTLVADSIVAVLHQKLVLKIQAQALFPSAGFGDPARALIRERKFGALTTIIQQQEARRDIAAKTTGK
jgi:twitching motility protein PilT